jgi:hypothetical protein
MAINPYKAIEWYRNKHRHSTKYMSDYELYERIKEEFPQYNYTDNPFQSKKTDESIPDVNTIIEDEQGFVEKLALSNLSEVWADDYDFAKRAYNNSISGTIYQIKHSKMKYDVNMATSGWAEDVGQFFLGLASPLDLGLFIGSGGVGGIAAKTFIGKAASTAGGKLIQKKLASEVTNQAAKRALKLGVNRNAASLFARKGALESGVSLATYGAAGGSLSNAAQQRIQIANGERESFNVWENIWEGTKHGITSGLMGAAGGALTKGVMTPQLAKARLASDKTFGNQAAQLLYGPAGQVGAEAAVFTGGQLGMMAYHGHEINMDTVMSTFFTNTGIIGGLKTGSKYLVKSKPAVDEYNRYKRNLYKEVLTKDKAIDKVISNKIKKRDSLIELNNEAVEEQNWDLHRTLKEEINKINANIAGEVEAAEIFGNKLTQYEQLLKKFNNKKPSELTPEEQRLLIEGSTAINLLTLSALKEMKNNPLLGEKTMGKQLYPDVPVDKLNTKQKDYIKSTIEERISELENTNKLMNETSIIGDDVDMQRHFAKNFNLDVKENAKKPGTYDVIVEAPNGKLVMDFDALKGLSKEQAKKIKKGLLKDIEDVVVGEQTQIKTSTTPELVKRTYKFVDKNTGQVIPWMVVGAEGREINLKKMTPAQAADINSKTQRGVFVPAETTGINISNPNQSGNSTTNSVLQGLTELKTYFGEKFETFEPKEVGKMPISVAAYRIKQTKFIDFITKPLKDLDPELADFRKKVFDKGDTKDLVNVLRQLENGEVALLAAFDMLHLKGEKSILTNTQKAIKFAAYLALNNKDIHTISGRGLSDLIKDGIPRFTIRKIDNRQASKTKGQIKGQGLNCLILVNCHL